MVVTRAECLLLSASPWWIISGNYSRPESPSESLLASTFLRLHFGQLFTKKKKKENCVAEGKFLSLNMSIYHSISKEKNRTQLLYSILNFLNLLSFCVTT